MKFLIALFLAATVHGEPVLQQDKDAGSGAVANHGNLRPRMLSTSVERGHPDIMSLDVCFASGIRPDNAEAEGYGKCSSFVEDCNPMSAFYPWMMEHCFTTCADLKGGTQEDVCTLAEVPPQGTPELPFCELDADYAEGGESNGFSVVEDKVLALMNQKRRTGISCPIHTGGTLEEGPQPAVVMNDQLRCAARVQAKKIHDYYVVNGNFGSHEGFNLHTVCDRRFQDQNCDSAAERIAKSGFVSFGPTGEIALGGQNNAHDIIAQFMRSASGHCHKIMHQFHEHPNLRTEVGVGYYEGAEMSGTVILVANRPLPE